jgi:D-xylonolactonase
MAFCLDPGESLPDGIRRIAHEQLMWAGQALTEGTDNPEEDIHSARKAMKRMRGLQRLVRRELGTYRLENIACRDAARQLAGLRDATVLISTFDTLADELDEDRREACASLRVVLENRRRAVWDVTTGSDGELAIDAVVAHLLAADARVDAWRLERGGWKMVEDGLIRVYRRGRREFDACSWGPSAARFHQWRKRVKYLYYQTQILKPLWPTLMKAWQDELDRLGDLLGDDHDLAVLSDTLRSIAPVPGVAEPLLVQIGERRHALQREALILGMRIYGERPRDLARRLRSSWRAWKEECILTGSDAVSTPAATLHGTEMAVSIERVADTTCKTGEGPLWHRGESRLYWVDIPAGRLYRFDPSTHGYEQMLEVEGAIGGFTVQADDSLLLFLSGGAIAVWRQGESLQYLVDGIDVERESRFNDVIADPAGRVFCGTMAGPAGSGRLYRLDTDGSLTELLDGIGCSNGMGFSPDRRTLYHIDSPTRQVSRFDWDEATGELTDRQVFVDTSDEDGVPDGMTVDADGFVWCARWGGGCLVRYSPDGVENRRITFPVRKVSSAGFGGVDLDELYVTTAGGDDRVVEGAGAGALFRLRPGVRGLPEFRSRVCL